MIGASTFGLQLSTVAVYSEILRGSIMRTPRKFQRTVTAAALLFAPEAGLGLPRTIPPGFSFDPAAPAPVLGAPIPEAIPDKDHVWNYDGGVFFATDGETGQGPCFRLSGRLTAPAFFNGLRRIDRIGAETIFQRGKEVVTQFPDQLHLQFVIFDFPCSLDEKPSPDRKLLTREDVSSLRLGLYWKHGVDLRPAENVKVVGSSVDPLYPPEIAHEHNLRERLEWTYIFQVPGEGVPLTDSLVLVIRNSEGRIAARVAARL
jgi:hypothetical protein